VLALPDQLSDVSPIDVEFFPGESVSVQELILMKDLDDTKCQQIPELSYLSQPIFALYNGEYWIHDPRFVSAILLTIRYDVGLSFIAHN
jgi:hypothetical protein